MSLSYDIQMYQYYSQVQQYYSNSPKYFIPIDYSIDSINYHVYYIKKDDKIITRKTHFCPLGMKCKNLKCVGHHHPSRDLDIFIENHR